MNTLLLTQSDLQELVSMKRAVAAVESAFLAHARGETLMPPKVYIELRQYDGDFRAMPAYLSGTAGLKWVNCHAENPARFGLPTVRGLYILSDPANADPLAVLDATWLTAERTGAAAAVASKHLARRETRTIGFVGCGFQAHTLLEAHRVVYADLEVVGADVDPAVAARFAEMSGGRVGDLAEASACDIVCTATPSRSPIVERRWIREGTHINAMGADAHGKQELESAILNDALVVVDDLAQAMGSGEINVPLSKRDIATGDIHASLGQILDGAKSGRTDDRQITVFDSTGLAIQDLALARVAYDAAIDRGIGRSIDFSS